MFGGHTCVLPHWSYVNAVNTFWEEINLKLAWQTTKGILHSFKPVFQNIKSSWVVATNSNLFFTKILTFSSIFSLTKHSFGWRFCLHKNQVHALWWAWDRHHGTVSRSQGLYGTSDIKFLARWDTLHSVLAYSVVLSLACRSLVSPNGIIPRSANSLASTLPSKSTTVVKSQYYFSYGT